LKELKIEKRVAIITIAFCRAYLVGIYLHENHKLVRILNSGRMAKSHFKYGLNFIATVLLNAVFHQISIFLNFCHVLRPFTIKY